MHNVSNKDSITNILITAVSKNHRIELDVKRDRAKKLLKDKIFSYTVTINEQVIDKGELSFKGSDEDLSKMLQVIAKKV